MPKPETTIAENPLAVRRNEKALKMITGKKPSIPTMRSRKGWRTGDNNKEKN